MLRCPFGALEMTFNPSIFILIGAVVTAIGVLITTLTLIAEHRRINALQKEVERQVMQHAQPQLPPVVTESLSVVHVATSSTFQGV